MDGSGLTIDNLNLRLPQGFAGRADAIVRQLGKELARLPLQHSTRIPVLQVPKIVVHGGESNRVIARRLATAIHRQISSPSHSRRKYPCR